MTGERRTAYHEAGHAVLTHRYGFQVRSVTIVLNEDARSHGCADFEPPPRGDRDTETVMACLGGYVAAQIATGAEDPRRWESRDYEEAAGRAWGAGFTEAPGTPSSRAYLSEREEMTKEELQRAWAAVEAVARALLEHGTLQGQEVARLVRDALA